MSVHLVEVVQNGYTLPNGASYASGAVVSLSEAQWSAIPGADIPSKVKPATGGGFAPGTDPSDFEVIQGGANISDRVLKEWTTAEAWEPTAITRDTSGQVSTITVRWPDDSAGTLTVTTVNATWEAVDAYTITHVDSGRKVIQTAPTRNSDGDITAMPVLTVEDI